MAVEQAFKPRSVEIEVGAYKYNVRWNGKIYDGGRRFLNIVGIGNKREYTIIVNKQGEVLENNTGFTGEKVATDALGWK